MAKKRVLIVDDAVVIRKILTDAISADADLEVVGTAANGKIALQKLTQCNPDIITLDVEMPEMDGLETLRNIRKTHPRIPVIMFSTLTERGGKATLEALSLGASDYVTKPANVGNVTASQQTVKDDLIRRIKGLTNSETGAPAVSTKGTTKSILPSSSRVKVAAPSALIQRIEIITIGISTGGPNALAAVLPMLPEDLGVPIVIVQHMPPMFTRLLAERLNAQCKLRVVEGIEGMPVEAGSVYIAPGNYHMEVVRRGIGLQIHLQQDAQENSCRPAADVLFRSVAGIFGGSVLAVIMTGMGKDGLHGCELVRDRGGRIIVQDEKTSVVWGMPGYVAEAGLAHAILPLENIAPEIIRYVKQNRSGISKSD